MDVKDLASELHTDPKTARRFLRAITPAAEQPGSGARWDVDKRRLRRLKTMFAEYHRDRRSD